VRAEGVVGATGRPQFPPNPGNPTKGWPRMAGFLGGMDPLLAPVLGGPPRCTGGPSSARSSLASAQPGFISVAGLLV